MSFASPIFLLALLVVPALLAVAVLADRRGARFPVSFTNLELLAGIVEERRRPLRRWLPLLLLLAALACAAGALAHPRVRLSAPDQNATIVLLVDVSGSMRATDVRPTRLQAAVAAMQTFLDKLPKQFKVGLVAFSVEPEPLVSPTANRALLQEAIGFLRPQTGTAIGDGLEVAIRMVETSLHQRGYVRRRGQEVPGAVVLLSDGKQNHGLVQPLQAAENARAAGIRVFPISLGTPHGIVTEGFGAFAQVFHVPPDPATMNKIAAVTGGRAYTAQTASTAVQIYRTLGSSIGRTRSLVDIASWFALAAAGLLVAALLAGRLVEGRVP